MNRNLQSQGQLHFAYAHGRLLTAVGFAASVVLIFVLMIAGSVFGNYLGRL